MTKLNDTRTIRLSNASRRDDGGLYPLPDSLVGVGPRVLKAIATMVKHGFVEERETSVAANVHRTDGDVRYGVFITTTGKEAIGVSDEAAGYAVSTPNPAPVVRDRQSKTSAVVALLERAAGATTAELIAATGWLPHTTRAALTGLRKKGHAIDRGKRGDETCYRIPTAA